jgi:hypothetical protein
MKYGVHLLIVFALVLACQRKSPAAVSGDKKIPECIQKKIDSIKAMPVWNPPAEIHEYTYNGKRVFLISADCCDFFATAVDNDCNYICAPSGGFTGKGDGKCKDFVENAKMVRIVWKDDRTKKTKQQ